MSLTRNKKGRKNIWRSSWKTKTQYREVALWSEDLAKFIQILERLEKFSTDAEIMHTRDIMALEKITKDSEILCKKYTEEFVAQCLIIEKK